MGMLNTECYAYFNAEMGNVVVFISLQFCSLICRFENTCIFSNNNIFSHFIQVINDAASFLTLSNCNVINNDIHQDSSLQVRLV